MAIKTPTVFVLGAGASAHLRYPLGDGLVTNIIGALSENASIRSKLVDFGFDPEELNEFKNSLFLSGRTSIDRFLEFRPEFNKIGKFLIAESLIRVENIEHLFSRIETNWYIKLFSAIDVNNGFLDQNNVAFITFNYDRSLDQFLFDTIRHSYHLSEDDVKVVLEKIPIVHVHGQIGFLPWQNDVNRPYDYRTHEMNLISDCSEGITIISEGNMDDDAIVKAKNIISASEIVHLLGTGFHPENMRQLGYPWQNQDLKIFGTCYQMSHGEIKKIHDLYDKIELCNVGWNISQYFREHQHLLV